MASISPISDVISAPPSSSLVLPPSNNALNSTSDTASANEAASSSATPSTSNLDGAESAQSTTSSTSHSSVVDTTTQPLDLVFDALATAGLDTAVDQTLLAPPTAQASGTFSIFMDQLFTAIAAQQAASAQAAAANTAAASQAAAAAATAEFAGNSTTSSPNSELEGNVQQLASQVQAANAPTTQSNEPSPVTLSPLQQSFDEFVASAGGNTSTTSLPTFLTAFANNLHSVPSPVGNLVDSVV